MLSKDLEKLDKAIGEFKNMNARKKAILDEYKKVKEEQEKLKEIAKETSREMLKKYRYTDIMDALPYGKALTFKYFYRTMRNEDYFNRIEAVKEKINEL